MAYTRVNWQNSPSHATPISAENLNVMDAGIASLDTAVTEAEGDISSLETEVGEQATTISGLQTTVQGHTASIGTLANLTTTEKSNLVGAINEVNEDVSDVKEDLNSFIKLQELFAFEVGSINTSGQNSDSSTRIRTKYMVWVKAGTTISYTSNNLAIVQYSDRNGTLISDNYWVGSYTVPQDCYIRIVVNGTDDTDAVWTGLGINLISNNLKIEYDYISDTVKKGLVSLNESVGLPMLKKSDFESGNLQMSANGWTYSSDQERARTKPGVTYPLKKGTKIHIASGYVAYIGWKIGDVYYNSGGWKDTIYETVADGDYVFLIRFSTESVVGFFVDNAFDAISLDLPTRISEVDYAMLTNQAKRFSLALSGVNPKLPNYDTTTKTLTIYSGMILRSHDGTAIKTLSSDVSISAVETSNNNVFVYNTSTESFHLLRFGANLSNAPYIILGEINIYNGKGVIQCGYTIDGYPVGSDNLVSKLPSAWASKIQDIQTAQGDKFIFAVQTDTHYTSDNATKIITSDIKDIKYFKNLTHYIGFDFVCNLGDLIQGYTNDTHDIMRASMTDAMEAYTTDISCPFMVAMGNHERNTMYATAQSIDPISFNEIWGRMFKPSFNTNPKVITQRGLMYYYTDFDDVRVIVLNTQDGTNGGFGISATQLSWFTSEALNTTKAVLVMSHVPLVDGWSVSSNYDSSYANIVSALQTFINNNGVVIGCMCGHIHKQEDKLVDGINYLAFDYQTGKAEIVQIDIRERTINTFMIGSYGSDEDRSFTY